MKKIYNLIVMLAFISCNSSKYFPGNYKSNFAEYGFFVTKIKFNNDSTVEFKKAGDLMNEDLTGTYKTSKNIVYLKFDKLEYDKSKDTLSVEEILSMPFDANEYQNMHSYGLKIENGIEYHLKYKIKNNKLLVYDNQTGKIIRKRMGSKNVAKFYLMKVND